MIQAPNIQVWPAIVACVLGIGCSTRTRVETREADGAGGTSDAAPPDAAAVDASGGVDGGSDGRPLENCGSDPAGTCALGFNCVGEACVAASVSCAAHKSIYPDSVDGVYWIQPSGTPMLAYCDMQERTELCTEIEEEHHGRTREGSNTPFAMTSILYADQGECAIWALRSVPENYPFTLLGLGLPHELGTCEAFGFRADAALGACKYGDWTGSTSCGFPVAAPYYQFGDFCDGCTLNDGSHDTYVLMGPVHSSDVLSDFGGSVQTRCRVR